MEEELLIANASARASEPELTPARIARLRRSLELAKRGELVSYEQVVARFDNFKKRLASR
jgi:hypothetical protein